MSKLVTVHGGDLDAVERHYGIKKEEISDFSGNINPLGFPENVYEKIKNNLKVIETYPDKNYLSLKKSISLYTGANSENVFVGNGSTELISCFIKSVSPKKTVIMGPAYSEYEREVKLIGSSFEYFELKEKDDFRLNTEELLLSLTPDVDLFIACNPNNPTGTPIFPSEMEKILDHCVKNNIYVMTDETYNEFSDIDISSIPLTNKYENLFVIRGTSKFFASPGIRLGYGITKSPLFKELLTKTQDPWSVNSIASFAGENMFLEKEFQQETKNLISKEREKAYNELLTIKEIKPYYSYANFILFKILTDKITASEIFEILIKKKMLVRNASSFTFLDESFMRFCILSPKENEMLISELKEIFKNL